MPLHFYKKFTSEQLTLQENLAILRTLLANERTFLAYFRTSLGLFVAGASLIRFFDDPWANLAGVLLIPSGLILFIIGAIRYSYTKREISVLDKSNLAKDSEND